MARSSPTADGAVVVNSVDRAPSKGNPRLIVVFSSIASDLRWLDFDGPDGQYLKPSRARLLFIYDDFGPDFSYYFGHGRSGAIADAVEKHIGDYANKHGVRDADIIFAGMSKGASAALLIGTRFPAATIIANAPQLRIGSYLLTRTEPILSRIAGGDSAEDVAWADHLVHTALASDVDRARPLVIMTGPRDANCYQGLRDDAALFARYPNLAVLSTNAADAKDHRSTMLHLFPAMVGLLISVASGIAAPTGLQNLGSGSRDRLPRWSSHRAHHLRRYLSS